MFKTMIGAVILTIAIASVALGATDTEKCQKKKLIALGRQEVCLRKERAKEVVGKTADFARCEEKLAKQIVAAEKTALCRWLDNGDGTATDLNTGLQWELKTDDGTIHDKDDYYAWCVDDDLNSLCDEASGPPDGPAFTQFLAALNGGVSADGSTTTGCFADKCDWRIPIADELEGILDTTAPGCGASACTTIPGETLAGFYWTSSTQDSNPFQAWVLNFINGTAVAALKSGDRPVRAVRGGP